MSSLIVDRTPILEIKPHSNADRLELAIIKGWQVNVPKDKYKPRDKVIYCPPDTVLPRDLSDALDVTKYLSSEGRVCSCRFRGEMSHGLVIPDDMLPNDTPDYKIAEVLGIMKYEPVIPDEMLKKAAPRNPKFRSYTDIENYKNFPSVIQEGLYVNISEKIHGTNFRAGWVDGKWEVGCFQYSLLEDDADIYWQASKLYNLKEILSHLGNDHYDVVIYGEVYGAGVTKLKYGLNKKEVAFFDLSINGVYQDWSYLDTFLRNASLPIVPQLYTGPWKDSFLSLAQGKSTLADHIKEGIVIRAWQEQVDAKLGRVILKYFNDDFSIKYHDANH